MRDRLESNVLSLEAQIEPDSRESLALLDRAIRQARIAKYLDNLTELLFLRAGRYRKLGKVEEAASDLESAIDLIEEWRQKIEVWSYRRDFLERERDVFDSLISLEIENFSDTGRAWNYVERLKGRTLMEVLRNRYAQADYKLLSFEDLETRLPANTSVFDVQADSWTSMFLGLDRGGLHFGGCAKVGNLGDRFKI